MSELEMKVEALIRCVPKDVWKNALAEVCKGKPTTEHNLEDVIREALREIGMPSHVLGFEYAVCAIASLYENPVLSRSLFKGLYAKVADKFDTTPIRAERCIRHGIETAWSRYGSELRDSYFNSISNPNKANPMTKEFLLGMVDIVRQKMR